MISFDVAERDSTEEGKRILNAEAIPHTLRIENATFDIGTLRSEIANMLNLKNNGYDTRK